MACRELGGALRDRTESQGYEFVNAGINGNTSADLRKRVDTDIVACRPSAVTIMIGGNDVLGGIPLDQYRDNLGAIVDRVKSGTTARIALMSLAPLGEDLDAELNQKLSAYNAVIKETATRAGVDFLPVHERLADHLRQRGGEPAQYDFSFPLASARPPSTTCSAKPGTRSLTTATVNCTSITST